MFCNTCGKEVPDNAVFCPECGAVIGGTSKSCSEPWAESSTGISAETQAEKSIEAVQEITSESKSVDDFDERFQKAVRAMDPFAGQLGFAVAGFVLSIMGSLVGAILGIIFSKKVMKAGGTSGLARAGLIIGIIQLVLNIIAVILVIIYYVAIMSLIMSRLR